LKGREKTMLGTAPVPVRVRLKRCPRPGAHARLEGAESVSAAPERVHVRTGLETWYITPGDIGCERMRPGVGPRTIV
jgi:hypothetical protein